jgi:putative transposase
MKRKRLNRYYREDVLDAHYFNDLYQLNRLNNKWKEDYNNNHPHKSLGDKSPRESSLIKSIKLKFDNFSEASNPILSSLAFS